MHFLVFSDSHGGSRNIMKVTERCINGIDGIIFLGDVYSDIEITMSIYPHLIYHAVAGNCDISAKYFSPEYQEKIINVDGVKVLLVHGHRQMVKSGVGFLESYARSKGVDAVLFGHTHERYEQYLPDGEKPLYMFNPGSAARPRDGAASFGVMTVEKGRILFSHGDVDADLHI